MSVKFGWKLWDTRTIVKEIRAKDLKGLLGMNFRKMHGLGNDFVILDHREDGKTLTPAQMTHICDRHSGVGCDQLVVLEPSEKADVFARFYNADGSESGACGNATRCVADIVMKEAGKGECAVETQNGVLPAEYAPNGMITVDMGAAALEWGQIPLAEERDTLDLGFKSPYVIGGTAVNMGNPHCVFFVDKIVDIPLEKIGPEYENNPLFPERTNVEFVQVISETKLRQRTWERGVGVTLACGSGACAVAVAGVRTGRTARKVEVELDGGTLFLEWRKSDGHVLMTGPVAYVFEGNLLT